MNQYSHLFKTINFWPIETVLQKYQIDLIEGKQLIQNKEEHNHKINTGILYVENPNGKNHGEC